MSGLFGDNVEIVGAARTKRKPDWRGRWQEAAPKSDPFEVKGKMSVYKKLK